MKMGWKLICNSFQNRKLKRSVTRWNLRAGVAVSSQPEWASPRWRPVPVPAPPLLGWHSLHFLIQFLLFSQNQKILRMLGGQGIVKIPKLNPIYLEMMLKICIESVLNLDTIPFLSTNHHVNHFNSLPAHKSSPSLNFMVSRLESIKPWILSN